MTYIKKQIAHISCVGHLNNKANLITLRSLTILWLWSTSVIAITNQIYTILFLLLFSMYIVQPKSAIFVVKIYEINYISIPQAHVLQILWQFRYFLRLVYCKLIYINFDKKVNTAVVRYKIGKQKFESLYIDD